MAVRRDQSPARLVGIDAAIMGRVAQRPGDITARAKRRQPGCQRGRLAAGRTAGAALLVPRIVSGAVYLVVALRILQHQRHVGFAIDDGASTQQALDEHGIFGSEA